MNPAHADSLSPAIRANGFSHGDHTPNGLVSQSRGQYRRRRSSFDFVQFGVANPASQNLDEKLIICRYWIRNLSQPKRISHLVEIAEFLEKHRTHIQFLQLD